MSLRTRTDRLLEEVGIERTATLNGDVRALAEAVGLGFTSLPATLTAPFAAFVCFDLPGFVVIKDTSAMVVNGTRCWGNGFMPASHQGVLLENGPEPIANLKPRASKLKQAEGLKLSFLQSLNQRHLQGRESNTELEARIRSYELAANMQMHAPESVDLEKEPASTKALYGLDQKDTKVFGQQCLLARRLVERGVRFVQLYHGAGSKWDSHTKMEQNHGRLTNNVDKPIAGLIQDLKQRGLLDETLVIWGGEFGRTPMSEKGDGRDHNHPLFAQKALLILLPVL